MNIQGDYGGKFSGRGRRTRSARIAKILVMSLAVCELLALAALGDSPGDGFKMKRLSEVNEDAGLAASMELHERNPGEGISHVVIRLENRKSSEAVTIQLFEDVSLSVVVSILAEKGERLSKLPKRMTTADRPKLQQIVLGPGQKIDWIIETKDILLAGAHVSDEPSRLHILADVYVDLISAPESDSGRRAAEFHLREMGITGALVR